MGKIVKFCNSCEESFAEKFAFCPNCGAGLQAFEMNPVIPQESKPEVENAPAPAEAAEPIAAASAAQPFSESGSLSDAPAATETVETVEEEAAMAAAFAAEEEAIAEENIEEEPLELGSADDADALETVSDDMDVVPEINVEGPAEDAVPEYVDSPITYPSAVTETPIDRNAVLAADTDFHVTVIEDKNSGQRNTLMMGAFMLVTFTVLSGLVYNIFSKDLEVGSISDDIFNAVLVEDVPMTVEEEQQKIRDKKDAGGGGGGGREEQEETTRGDLADQSRTPTRPPDAKVFRSDNFELKLPPPQTEGDRKFEKKYDRWGDPNGRFESFSNGTGSGGGQGTGAGTGQGSGRGTGVGSGDGSGSGSGLGSGNGSGTGRGNQGDDDGPPPRPTGVTQPLKILSKPRPGYTDAARQNNVQGTVILRVTFLPSGQIGSISAVKGLPYGLTEQAIAAARQMRFEPAKRDGIGQAVTRQVEYTFSIY
jgi:protein TonB